MKILLLHLFLLLPLASALAQKVEKAVSPPVQDPMDIFQEKIRTQQATIDSLILIVMGNVDGTSIIADLDESKELNEDELALGKLALKLDQAIYTLERSDIKDRNREQEVDEILHFFAPQFSANIVVLDIEGKAQVARLTRIEFKEEFIKHGFSDNSHHKTLNIDFLDTEIVGDLSNITYKSLIEFYENEKHVSNKTILTTLTCRKINRLWKIGSFSRTTIEYKPEK